MQSPQAKLKEITRLLASWPSAHGEGDEQLRSYLLAVEDYRPDDVEAAVTALIKGSAPGVNPNFLPPPATVGAECRRQLLLRLDHEQRSRPRLPPPPQIIHDEDSRAAVADTVKGFVEDVGQRLLTEDAADARRKADRWAKTNARFTPDQSDEAIAKRLGFSSGDPVGEADAA